MKQKNENAEMKKTLRRIFFGVLACIAVYAGIIMWNFVIVFEHTEYVYENPNQAQIKHFMDICELDEKIGQDAECLYLRAAPHSGESTMALVVDGKRAEQLEGWSEKGTSNKIYLSRGIAFVSKEVTFEYEAEVPQKKVVKMYRAEGMEAEEPQRFVIFIYRGVNGEKVLIEAHGSWAMMQQLVDLADSN